jgi:protein-S-isoprenylcysteine O-methyltransferase Ste14
METLVIVLRVLSLLAFAGPMLLAGTGRRGRAITRPQPSSTDRAPLAANLFAFGVLVLSLLLFSGSALGTTALLLAASGSILAGAGAAVILRSRTALGPAWSFVPKADESTGLATTGPYRLVRHPIYLGFIVLAVGQALAFGSGPALVIVMFGILPTFVWRARAEERALHRIFGERYSVYRRRTKKRIIPFLL